MANVVLLVFCLAVGILLRWSGRLPDNAPSVLNALVINISLPALVLRYIHGVEPDRTLAAAVAMPWLLFTLGGLAFWALARVAGLSRETTGALIIVGGLGNTSFVGLPMIETFYGTRYLPVGIAIDQLGSYLVLSTLGILVACIFSATQPSAGLIVRRITTFPPLIALLVALAVASVPFPAVVVATLDRLAGTVAPLALLSVGLQLRLGALAGNRVALAAGLGFKLIVGPAVIALVYLALLNGVQDTARVTLFEAAMAPMIGGSVVAMQYRLNPELVTLMVGLGTLASFVTLPIWWGVLAVA